MWAKSKENLLEFFDLLEKTVFPERNSILQTAALQHHITAAPKHDWKGREINSPESQRSFRNRLLAGFP
jgi:hypothetical protein